MISVTHDESTPGQHLDVFAAHRPMVMLLGSGEFSRELTIALQRLGARVVAVERYANAPAHGVADESLVVKIGRAHV